jgi:hypothetical protein
MAIRDPKREPPDEVDYGGKAGRQAAIGTIAWLKRPKSEDSKLSPDKTHSADRPKVIPAKGDLLSLGPPTISLQGLSLSQSLKEQREERL